MKRWALLWGILLMFSTAASAQENPKAEVFGGYHGGADFGNGNVYTYLFGPKVAFRNGRWTPYVQTLFGGAHASGEVSCLAVVAGARPRPQAFTCGSGSLSSFAMTAGGGLDVNATDHVGIRLIQAEYFMTRLGGITENGTRVSAGVVFRW